ncbi:MAG: U32 family peptidase, partial [Muribaculaceae bacterium]|nr:U32 family peptidase [Muribaculaceae bacterium]
MMRQLELLAPAADRDVAVQAILHGADAVYMGGPSHGARRKAANSIDDIRATVEFAHRYRARVYVTVNTLVYENELRKVEALCRDLYLAGVDALIVQDMSLLRLDIPPITLHASTQCDTRTPEKARFLQDAGFSQIVLARELSIDETRRIADSVDVPLECFVHGALCVSYSGRCAASQVSLGRSANRGECAQMCRLPYTLRNGRGEVVEKDRYLLSLRDFNASARIEEMALAGVSSFKIEGRLKDSSYVKNVTAAYRHAIDAVIARHPGMFCRSSCGKSKIAFTPDLSKSFNRGFTEYFLDGRHPGTMASLSTPKSMGEIIRDPRMLNNGDGISFFNASGEYEGVGVNRVENGRIVGSRPFRLPKGAVIHRTLDRCWQSLMSRDTASRSIRVDITIDETGVSAADERGVKVRVALDADRSVARKPMDPRPVFAKLGGTVYRLGEFVNNLAPSTFIPASQRTALRRR